MTPEGRVKGALKKILKEAGVAKPFWPVQNGMGATHLDCILAFQGVPMAIEVKAPGNHPTARQMQDMHALLKDGWIVCVYDGPGPVDVALRAWFATGEREYLRILREDTLRRLEKVSASPLLMYTEAVSMEQFLNSYPEREGE